MLQVQQRIALNRNGTAIRRTGEFAPLDTLLQPLKILKQFVRIESLALSDFNIINSIDQLNQSPAPGQATLLATVKTIHLHSFEGREVIERRILKLIEGGYVLKIAPGQWSSANPNTYTLTKAGRNLIQSFYEYREEMEVAQRRAVGRFNKSIQR